MRALFRGDRGHTSGNEQHKTARFAVGYQTGFAYTAALIMFHFGKLPASGGFGAGMIAALLVLALLRIRRSAETPANRNS